MNKPVNGDKSDKLIVEESLFSRMNLLSKNYISEKYKEEISKAGIIVIPNENLREGLGFTFPEQTIEIIDYLKKNIDTAIEYAVDDEDFQVLELHSIDIIVPLLFIAHEVGLPLVLSGFYDYIKSNVFSSRKHEVNIKIEMYHETEEGSKYIKYEGSVEDFEKVLKKY